MKTRRFALFLCIVTLLAPLFGVVASAKTDIAFPDVTETTRFREAILALANANIIQGRSDLAFRPTSSLLRGEIIKLIMESQNLAPEDFSESRMPGCFTDVRDQGQWYFSYLCTAKKLGIAKGYPDGSFQPGKEITRSEAIALLCRTQNWETGMPEKAPFNDAKLGEWFTPCIAYAKTEGFLKNITRKSRLVLPGIKMQRGAFTEILYRSLLKQGKSFEVPLDETAPEALLIASQPLRGLTAVSDIEPLKQQLLDFTNNERIKNGLPSVGLADELSGVAQKHSNNMVIHKFFDHIDHEGKSPDDRRLDAGVTTLVGENLAKAPSIETAHEGLMNSPPHRKNILTPEWQRMGIGIAQDEEGYLLITELFSTNPVMTADLQTEKSALLNLVNEKRSEQNIPPLTENSTLQSLAESWSRDMADLNFFAAQHPNGETLINRVKNQFPATLYQVALYESNKIETFRELFLKDPGKFMNAQLKKVGLGFAMDTTGIIALTVIFTN